MSSISILSISKTHNLFHANLSYFYFILFFLFLLSSILEAGRQVLNILFMFDRGRIFIQKDRNKKCFRLSLFRWHKLISM